MTTEPGDSSLANAGGKQKGPHRFQPGQSGNPAGKRRGTRNRVSVLAEKLMGDDVESVVAKVILEARGGDMTAARLVLDRIVPPRKGRPVRIDLPPVATPADLIGALRIVIGAVSTGALTTDEAVGLAQVLDSQRRAIETADLEERLRIVERRIVQDGQ